MKKLFLFFCSIVFLTSCATTSTFQGRIIYKYQYLDKSGKNITDQVKEMDTEQRYYINPANYKSYNQNGELTQLYNSISNKYFYSVGMELESIDASTPSPKSFSVQDKKGEEKILNHTCKKILVTTEVGSVLYYFDKNVKVNKAPFMKHRFGNWSQYLSKTKGALPLKFILTNKEGTLVATAIEIKLMTLSNEEFEVQKALRKNNQKKED